MPYKIFQLAFLLCLMLLTEHSFASFRIKRVAVCAADRTCFDGARVDLHDKFPEFHTLRQRIRRYGQKDKSIKSTGALVVALVGLAMAAIGIGLTTTGLSGEIILGMGVYGGAVVALIGAIGGIVALVKHKKNKGCAIAAIGIAGLFVILFFVLMTSPII